MMTRIENSYCGYSLETGVRLIIWMDLIATIPVCLKVIYNILFVEFNAFLFLSLSLLAILFYIKFIVLIKAFWGIDSKNQSYLFPYMVYCKFALITMGAGMLMIFINFNIVANYLDPIIEIRSCYARICKKTLFIILLSVIFGLRVHSFIVLGCYYKSLDKISSFSNKHFDKIKYDMPPEQEKVSKEGPQYIPRYEEVDLFPPYADEDEVTIFSRPPVYHSATDYQFLSQPPN